MCHFYFFRSIIFHHFQCQVVFSLKSFSVGTLFSAPASARYCTRMPPTNAPAVTVLRCPSSFRIKSFSGEKERGTSNFWRPGLRTEESEPHHFAVCSHFHFEAIFSWILFGCGPSPSCGPHRFQFDIIVFLLHALSFFSLVTLDKSVFCSAAAPARFVERPGTPRVHLTE